MTLFPPIRATNSSPGSMAKGSGSGQWRVRRSPKRSPEKRRNAQQQQETTHASSSACPAETTSAPVPSTTKSYHRLRHRSRTPRGPTSTRPTSPERPVRGQDTIAQTVHVDVPIGRPTLRGADLQGVKEPVGPIPLGRLCSREQAQPPLTPAELDAGDAMVLVEAATQAAAERDRLLREGLGRLDGESPQPADGELATIEGRGYGFSHSIAKSSSGQYVTTNWSNCLLKRPTSQSAFVPDPHPQEITAASTTNDIEVA